MKPVFKEEYISKLKGIIEETQPGNAAAENINEIVNHLESSLGQSSDDQENTIFVYGSAALVIVFASILMYTTKASWPLMFIIVWIGAFMYYRVHEKGLTIDRLQKKALINPHNPIPKMDFLVSDIDLRIGRKDVLKGYLSLLLSSTVMMAHRLFVDSSVTLNMFLLIGAIVASWFFWNNFFKEDIEVLNDVKSKLQVLKSKLILDRRFEIVSK